MLHEIFIAPFTEFEFMRRALAGALALALGAAPIGVFLMLRRMSLVGDAMAHAILPGAAVGFLLSGLSLFAMTAGGLIAGFVVALLTGLVARTTELKEDAALATFYLLSLAVGVTIISLKGTNIDLLHVLFGNVLAVGIMMLPAAIGRFWARDTTLMILIATASGVVASYAGLLVSFHFGVASGPAIILVAGALYLTSLLFGRVGGLVRQLFPGRHLEA